MYLFNGIPKLCTQAWLTAFFCCGSIGGTKGPVGKWSRSRAKTYLDRRGGLPHVTALQSSDDPNDRYCFWSHSYCQFPSSRKRHATLASPQPKLCSGLAGASPGSCVLVFVLQHIVKDVDLQIDNWLLAHRKQGTSQAALIQTSGHPGWIYWLLSCIWKITNAT